MTEARKDSQAQAEEHVFDLSGGALCLDFANTVGDRPRRREEHLHRYENLLAWGRQTGVLDRRTAARLERRAKKDPSEARRVLEVALARRESLYRLFSALAAGRRPPAAELAALNRGLSAIMPLLRIAEVRGELAWSWAADADRLDRMLWQVERSAADLLTSGEAAAVRECDSDRCSWLFIDRSPGRRRRWCDMKTCGNRAKARRHYHRKKQAQRGPKTGHSRRSE